MKKLYLFSFFLICSHLCSSQNTYKKFNYKSNSIQDADSDGDGIEDSIDDDPYALDEVSLEKIVEPTFDPLTGGGLNYGQGYLQTSAKILKILIGKPGKFRLPVFLLVNSLTDVASNTNDNEKATLTNLFNPTAGYLNFGIQGADTFSDNLTSVGYTYQFGGKLIGAQSPGNTDNTNLISGVLSGGLYFFTDAEISGLDLGVFWVRALGILSIGDGNDIANLLSIEDPSMSSKISGEFFILKAELGLNIPGAIELNVSYLKNFTDDDLLPVFNDGIIQGTFDYSF